MSNPYYDNIPNMERVDCLDESLSYEFNILLVVRDIPSGRIFFAQDSGCSCPSPFEDYHFTSATDNNMDEVTKHNFSNFESCVKNFPVSMEEIQNCLTKVKGLLRSASKYAED